MIGIKRTCLLALAAGVLISPAAMAADVDGPSGNYFWGKELLELANAPDVAFTDVIAVQLGSEYAVGDKITLAFSGSALDDATLPTSVVVACVDNTNAGMTWGLLNSDADHGTWRVTEIDTATCVAATSTTDVVVEFGPAGNVEFGAPAVLANNGVAVQFSAETNAGDPLDTSGGVDRSANLITVMSQFGYSVDKFTAVIDVNTQRTTLIPGPWDAAAYALDPIDFPMDCCTGFVGVSNVDADVTWTGDFSWIADGNELTPAIDPLPGVVSTPGCGPFVVTATEITATCSSFNAALVLDPSVNGNPDLATLPAGNFDITIASNYTDFGFWGGAARDGTATFSNLDAGDWGLNGYQAELPYTPFGAGIGAVIYIANRGSQSGDISVDWIGLDSTSGSCGVITSIGPTSTLSLGPLIQACLPQAQQESGRLALTITANIPAADGQLNAQYNASGNRAFTLQSDNRDD